MTRRLKILMLTHADLVPPETLDGLAPDAVEAISREWRIREALLSLGHEVEVLGVEDDLLAIRRRVEEMAPDVVFNLVLRFQDVSAHQVHLVSYLELLRVPYTGCNPAGILLSRGKALAKQIFRYHRVPTPAFAVVRRGRRPRLRRELAFPLIVKPVSEEGGFGIAQASVVRDEAALDERVEFVHDGIGDDALVERYVRGRELTVSVLGNDRLRTFPVWELTFANLPEGAEAIQTDRIKWDRAYQARIGLDSGAARGLPEGAPAQIARLARRAYRALRLSGYARMDLRLGEDGQLYFIEANATPDLSESEDFAESAQAAGVGYPELLARIVNLGLRHRPPWRRQVDDG